MRKNISIALVLGLEMTARCVSNVFKSALEFAVIFRLVRDLHLIVLENINILIDLSVGEDGSVLDGEYHLVLEFIQTVGYFNLSTHAIRDQCQYIYEIIYIDDRTHHKVCDIGLSDYTLPFGFAEVVEIVDGCEGGTTSFIHLVDYSFYELRKVVLFSSHWYLKFIVFRFS